MYEKKLAELSLRINEMEVERDRVLAEMGKYISILQIALGIVLSDLVKFCNIYCMLLRYES